MKQPRSKVSGRYMSKGGIKLYQVIIGAALGLLVLGGLLTSIGKEDYIKPDTEIVETQVEVTPDWASDEEAVEAAQAVIRRKVLEEQKNALEGEISALKAQYESDLAAKQEELDNVLKELGTY